MRIENKEEFVICVSINSESIVFGLIVIFFLKTLVVCECCLSIGLLETQGMSQKNAKVPQFLDIRSSYSS